MPALDVSSAVRGGPDALASAARAVNTITVRHWGRLRDGALLAASARLDWATLLRRTYGVDALKCSECQGRMRPMAVITDRDVARKILTHLGMHADAPVLARARDPTWDDTPAQATLPWLDS